MMSKEWHHKQDLFQQSFLATFIMQKQCSPPHIACWAGLQLLAGPHRSNANSRSTTRNLIRNSSKLFVQARLAKVVTTRGGHRHIDRRLADATRKLTQRLFLLAQAFPDCLGTAGFCGRALLALRWLSGPTPLLRRDQQECISFREHA